MDRHRAAPTGLERITALEVKVDDLQREVAELIKAVRNVQDLLVQGRGVRRVILFLLAVGGALGLTEMSKLKLAEILRWLGS